MGIDESKVVESANISDGLPLESLEKVDHIIFIEKEADVNLEPIEDKLIDAETISDFLDILCAYH